MLSTRHAARGIHVLAILLFFLKIFLFLSNLDTLRGAPTDSPDVKICMFYQVNQPGAPRVGCS